MTRLRLIIPVLALVVLGAAAVAEDGVPLRNWAAPIFWSPGTGGDAPRHGQPSAPLSPEFSMAGTATPLPFVAVAPCRLIDTRAGSGFPSGYGPPSLPGGSQRTFTIAGQCGIPADAQAVSFNFTVWAPVTRGDIRVFPAGGTTPLVSTLNWEANILALANAAIVPLGTGGAIRVQVDGTGTIDLFVDVNGYYSPLGVVNSVNALSGAVTIAAGNNVTVTPAGQTLTIAAVAASGSMTIGQPGDTTLLGQGYTETWPSYLESWTSMPMTNAPPNLARAAFCAVWTGSKFFVWGGQDINYQGLNTGSLYDPATNSWTLTGVSGAAAARRYPHCVWTGSKVVVWGGEDSSAVAMNSGGRYDPVLDTWSPMTATGAPQGRIVGAAVWSGSRMVVWGGVDRTTLSNTYPAAGGRYDPTGDVWEGLSTTSQPPPRGQPSMVWTGTYLIVWGGYTGASPPFTQHNTGGRYDPLADTWQATTLTNAPSARYSSFVVWTGSQMIVWGGVSGNSPTLVSYNDGALYDPGGDAWTGMSTASAPQARVGPPGAWTGTRMIVWGGTNATGSTSTPLNTGGIYDPGANRWVAPTTNNGVPSARGSHQMVWTGSPFNEMLLIGPDNAGYVYRPLSMYVKN